MQKIQMRLKESKLKYTAEERLKWECSFAVSPSTWALQQKDFSYVPARSLPSCLQIRIFISKFCTVLFRYLRIALPNQIPALMLRFLLLEIANN